jgi:hypothetical protein
VYDRAEKARVRHTGIQYHPADRITVLGQNL